jgi:hypothetical protein
MCLIVADLASLFYVFRTHFSGINPSSAFSKAHFVKWPSLRRERRYMMVMNQRQSPHRIFIGIYRVCERCLPYEILQSF